MNTHIRLIGALGFALASATIGVNADTCVEKATRLRSGVESLPSSDPARKDLSSSLEMAMTADPERCEEIVARVERELDAATEGGHASAEKPVPNYPNTPAAETGGPGFSDDDTSTAGVQDETEGHASEENPIPNKTEIPAASRGPSYEEDMPESTDTSTSDEASSMEAAPEGHATEEDPVPNEPEVSSQGADEDEAASDSDDEDEEYVD